MKKQHFKCIDKLQTQQILRGIVDPDKDPDADTAPAENPASSEPSNEEPDTSHSRSTRTI